MRAVLLLLLAVPTLALAQAGRFLLAAGEVTVVRGAQNLPASIGTGVAVGDTVRVGARSGAQIRMSDETIVALRSNTVFRIDEHVNSGRGEDTDRTVFSLLKGGMRAVTGALARQPAEGLVRTAAKPEAPSAATPTPGAKPAERGEDSEGGLLGFIRAPLRAVAGAVSPTRHSVRLPTATVGIRGTHYTLVHCDNDCYVTPRTTVASIELAQSDTGQPGLGNLAPNGSYGGVSDGLIGIVGTNQEFGANEFLFIAPDGSIQRLIAPPSFLYDTLEVQERNRGQGGNETTEGMQGSGLNAESRPSDTPTPPTPQPFIVTEQRNDSGDPIVIAGTGTAATVFLSAFDTTTGGPGTVAAFVNGGLTTETFSGDGFFVELTSFNVPAGSTANSATGAYSGSATSVGDLSNGGLNNALGAIWGRWFDGTVTDASGTTVIDSPATYLHYLIGPNTPPEVIAAKTGTATFGLVSGTENFSASGIGVAAATFRDGTFSVDFTSRQVSLPSETISLSGVQSWSINPDQVQLTVKPGGGVFFHSNAGATCSGSSCLGSGQVQRTGAFMGPVGDHVGMAFRGQVSGTQPATFTGTAIFTSSQPPAQ